jgi:hypothetical protein
VAAEEAFARLKETLERGAGQAERGELLDGAEVFVEERHRGKQLMTPEAVINT